jgi:DNA-binding XRE family transcriptional regulator
LKFTKMSNLQSAINALQNKSQKEEITNEAMEAVTSRLAQMVQQNTIPAQNTQRQNTPLYLGGVIKTQRNSLNLSQRELARISHVSQTTIVRIEKGWTQNIHAIDAVAKALNGRLEIIF